MSKNSTFTTLQELAQRRARQSNLGATFVADAAEGNVGGVS